MGAGRAKEKGSRNVHLRVFRHVGHPCARAHSLAIRPRCGAPRLQGSGFRVRDRSSKFKVQGAGFRVQG
eukprot:3641418-Alexandrium_andersonii.AAC.1